MWPDEMWSDSMWSYSMWYSTTEEGLSPVFLLQGVNFTGESVNGSPVFLRQGVTFPEVSV